MRRLVLAASLLILASSLARAADCDACMPDKMCVRHQKEQDDALKEFNKEKKDKNPMKRKAALDKLGKLNDQHMNHRGTDVATAIAFMLDDTDTGIRMGALTYLKTNQNVKTSKEEIGKLLDKMLPKVSKGRPSGKLASSPQALEWDNTFAMCKECLSGLQYLGGEDAADYFLKAIDSDNLELAAEAIEKSATIHSKKLVVEYLARFAKMLPAKEEDQKRVAQGCARSFISQTNFPEPLADDMVGWEKKARAWWKEKEADYDPPAAPPKDPGAGK